MEHIHFCFVFLEYYNKKWKCFHFHRRAFYGEMQGPSANMLTIPLFYNWAWSWGERDESEEETAEWVKVRWVFHIKKKYSKKIFTCGGRSGRCCHSLRPPFFLLSTLPLIYSHLYSHGLSLALLRRIHTPTWSDSRPLHSVQDRRALPQLSSKSLPLSLTWLYTLKESE